MSPARVVLLQGLLFCGGAEAAALLGNRGLNAEEICQSRRFRDQVSNASNAQKGSDAKKTQRVARIKKVTEDVSNWINRLPHPLWTWAEYVGLKPIKPAQAFEEFLSGEEPVSAETIPEPGPDDGGADKYERLKFSDPLVQMLDRLKDSTGSYFKSECGHPGTPGSEDTDSLHCTFQILDPFSVTSSVRVSGFHDLDNGRRRRLCAALDSVGMRKTPSGDLEWLHQSGSQDAPDVVGALTQKMLLQVSFSFFQGRPEFWFSGRESAHVKFDQAYLYILQNVILTKPNFREFLQRFLGPTENEGLRIFTIRQSSDSEEIEALHNLHRTAYVKGLKAQGKELPGLWDMSPMMASIKGMLELVSPNSIQKIDYRALESSESKLVVEAASALLPEGVLSLLNLTPNSPERTLARFLAMLVVTGTTNIGSISRE